MSRLFAEREWHIFYKKGDDYTEYPMLEEQDRVSGNRDIPVAPEGGRGNPTPGAGPDLDNLPEGLVTTVIGILTAS